MNPSLLIPQDTWGFYGDSSGDSWSICPLNSLTGGRVQCTASNIHARWISYDDAATPPPPPGSKPSITHNSLFSTHHRHQLLIFINYLIWAWFNSSWATLVQQRHLNPEVISIKLRSLKHLPVNNIGSHLVTTARNLHHYSNRFRTCSNGFMIPINFSSLSQFPPKE